MINVRLLEAALAGSVDLLHRLAREDPALLDQPPAGAPDLTPFHSAILYGHAEFVRAALALKPDLSRRRNAMGSLPLHLAAARDKVEIVRELARADPGACLERDEQGHTPLHVAAMRGLAGALTEMVRANPVAARALTEGGETALHLCAKNDQLDALKLLVEGLGGDDGDVEFLNKGDGDGNTALHLSVEKRHVQIVKYLVSTTRMEINALNNKGRTALDSVESGWTEFADAVVENILVGAGAERTERLSTEGCNTNKQTKKGVYKIDLHDRKERTRVMKAAIGIEGVDSISFNAKDNLLTIIGEIDFVQVTIKLQKKSKKLVQLVSVGTEKEPMEKEDYKKGQENNEKNSDTNAQVAELVKAYKAYNLYMTTAYPVYSVEHNPNVCAIS